MPVKIPAGEFSKWLRDTEAAFRSGKDSPNVPCGTCTACCRSSMFIHIEPLETKTTRRIPASVLFAAPGRPEGHLLMGYDENGRCPMLAVDKCSIYKDRPQACRSYDCRVFAATGIPVDVQAQPDIAARIDAWDFEYATEASRDRHTLLKRAAAFLRARTDLFPSGTLPSEPGALAALAIRVHRLFSNQQESKIVEDIVKRVAITKPVDSAASIFFPL
jgi:Fe-S-cluster containining protein